LIQKNWPNYLIIFNGLYLQSVLYTDSTPGIIWYIVILLPAQQQPDHLGADAPQYYVSLVASIIAIVICVTALSLTIYFWKSRMMQLAQPIFIVVVQMGCVLLGIACIVFLGPNNTANCSARIFLFNIALTIAFCPLLIKCYRVYIMFVYSFTAHVLNHGGSNKLLTKKSFALSLFGFVAVDLLIILVSVYSRSRGSAPYKSTQLSNNGAYVEFTYCGYHKLDEFFYSEMAYKASLVLVACYLSFTIRSVVDGIAGSKVLLAIVYNTAFIGAIVIALVRSVESVQTIIMCQILGICYCIIVASVLIIAPTLYSIAYVGDKVAANEVIDEMFEARLQNAVS